MNGYLILVLLSISATSAVSAKQNWKSGGDLETLVSKDKSIVDRAYGGVQQLRKHLAKKYITPEIYLAELQEHIFSVSTFLGSDIRTEQELDEVFAFFSSKMTAKYSASAQASGVFTFTNILLFVGVTAIFLLILAFVAASMRNLDTNSKVIAWYVTTVVVFFVAKFICGGDLRPYVAFVGAMLFGGVYCYHIKVQTLIGHDHQIGPLYLVPVMLVWGIVAVHFDSRLVGVMCVGALDVILWMLAGEVYPGVPMLIKTIAVSGALLALYILSAMRAYYSAGIAEIDSALSIFEPGVVIMGTFLFFVSLLMLSSGFYYKSDKEKYRMCNILAAAVGLLSFYLGTAVPALTLFRGTASTFFALFVLLKWAELIPWRSDFFCLGVLGGGVLIIVIGLFVKANTYLFVFSPQ